MKIEWDFKKAAINKKKHGVSFSEAESVFFDPNARLIYDEDNSGKEERFLLLGMSTELRLLVVCHCIRGKNDIIRIISARKAVKSERKTYGSFL